MSSNVTPQNVTPDWYYTSPLLTSTWGLEEAQTMWRQLRSLADLPDDARDRIKISPKQAKLILYSSGP